jgi:hypothetical protein
MDEADRGLKRLDDDDDDLGNIDPVDYAMMMLIVDERSVH